ncbi:MAG: hypothetical protein ACRD26_17555 [Vicinamibacterales bacterium]
MHQTVSTCVVAIGAVLCAGSSEAQFRVPPPPAPGEDYKVELGLAFWSPEPDLVIRFDDPVGPAGAGSDVDFVQEFGIAKKRFTEVRATIKPGRKHKIRFDYVPFKYDADATIQRTFVFGGRQFTVGVPASTAVTWDLWKFGYEWDFVSGQTGYAGLVVDLKYSKVSAEISSPGLGAELAEANAPVPGIGGIARGYFTENVSVTGEFTAFKVFDRISEEIDGTFYDFDVYGMVNFGRNFGLQGGYRSITVDYLREEDAGALKMKGTYFGGVLRF